MKLIFAALSFPELLKKCLHGKTQNVNKLLNQLIWNRLLKSTFVGMDTVCMGVYDAVSVYND